MGGSAIGADLAFAALPPTAGPGRGRARLPAARVGRAAHPGDRRQLLGRHRGDPDLRAGRAWRAAAGPSACPRAAGWPHSPASAASADRSAGGRQPRAALGHLTAPLLAVPRDCRPRGGSIVERGRGGELVEPGDAELHPDVARGHRQGDGPDAARQLGRHVRCRRHGSGGAALEGPDQRERQGSGLLQRASRARPQRDRRLGGQPRLAEVRVAVTLETRRRPAAAPPRDCTALLVERRARGRGARVASRGVAAAGPVFSLRLRSAIHVATTWPCSTASTRRR